MTDNTPTFLAIASLPITAFASDEQGNLYVFGYQGIIWQLDFSGATLKKSVEDSVPLSTAVGANNLAKHKEE